MAKYELNLLWNYNANLGDIDPSPEPGSLG